MFKNSKIYKVHLNSSKTILRINNLVFRDFIK